MNSFSKSKYEYFMYLVNRLWVLCIFASAVRLNFNFVALLIESIFDFSFAINSAANLYLINSWASSSISVWISFAIARVVVFLDFLRLEFQLVHCQMVPILMH